MLILPQTHPLDPVHGHVSPTTTILTAQSLALTAQVTSHLILLCPQIAAFPHDTCLAFPRRLLPSNATFSQQGADTSSSCRASHPRSMTRVASPCTPARRE